MVTTTNLYLYALIYHNSFFLLVLLVVKRDNWEMIVEGREFEDLLKFRYPFPLIDMSSHLLHLLALIPKL